MNATTGTEKIDFTEEQSNLAADVEAGKAPRCSLRRVVAPAQCGSSLRPKTAGVSDAGCSSALVLPQLYPARISVSSSLLTATMNQKSSLREDPQFVLMGDDGEQFRRSVDCAIIRHERERYR